MRRGQDYHGERKNIWKRENSGAFVIGNEQLHQSLENILPKGEGYTSRKV